LISFQDSAGYRHWQNDPFVNPRSASFMPIITLVASFAKGTPVALLTKGTVRDALGLTSRT
jgi:hypothetical protein